MSIIQYVFVDRCVVSIDIFSYTYMVVSILRSGSFNVSEFDGNKDNDMYVYSNTQKWFFYVLQFMETIKTIYMYIPILKWFF